MRELRQAYERGESFQGDQYDNIETLSTRWKMFLFFPRMLLAPVPTKEDREGSYADVLRSRIRRFDLGQWTELLQEAQRTGVSRARRRPNQTDIEIKEARLAQAAQLIQQGEFSHAARVLKPGTLAPGTPATLAELTNPELRPPRLLRDLPAEVFRMSETSNLQLNKDIFVDCLRSCRKGLSPGVAGNRYEYMKLCLEEQTSLDDLVFAATRFAQARLPEDIREAFAISKMTALQKPNGKIRGVCAGDAFRRLVSKTLARQFNRDFRAATLPFNFGLSNRSGTDALAHLVRTAVTMSGTSCLLSTDGVGAFDHVLRSSLLRALIANPAFHELVPFVRMWYGQNSKAVWHDEHGAGHVIEQGEGGDQGDALMPALFCLAMHSALVDLKADLGDDAIVVAYLDDIYIIVPVDHAARAVERARHHLAEHCGIQVHQGKLKAYCPNASSAQHGLGAYDTNDNEVWVHNGTLDEQGIMVVGTPIGTPEFVQSRLDLRLDAQSLLTAEIELLEEVQHKWLLNYYCAVPRINHLLRTLPPEEVLPFAQAHDLHVQDVVARLKWVFRLPTI